MICHIYIYLTSFSEIQNERFTKFLGDIGGVRSECQEILVIVEAVEADRTLLVENK